MAGLHLVVVLRPLLDLSPPADLERIQLGARSLDLRAKIRVDLENVARFNGPPEKLLGVSSPQGETKADNSASIAALQALAVARRQPYEPLSEL